MSFEFSENELPEVKEERSYKLDEKSFAAGKTVTYYEVGDWSMSSLDVEDADLETARRNALAWIAWYNFLKQNPHVVVDTAENSNEG